MLDFFAARFPDRLEHRNAVDTSDGAGVPELRQKLQ